LALVFVLDDWGFRVSALVAGLGIGGAAVALAAQAILKDWFGYVAIVSDRPFEIGDLIALGPDYTGTVVDITVRSVRLRSVAGEELILPNANVATARVRNYSRATQRRVAFAFGVPSGTPAGTLDRIPELVRVAVDAQPELRFERCVWTGFGDATFTFEAAYSTRDTRYDAHLAPQHAIFLALARGLHDLGIAPAAPHP
jgi:small-conductance mechanosensitive channel